jgi:hypothetical protein
LEERREKRRESGERERKREERTRTVWLEKPTMHVP